MLPITEEMENQEIVGSSLEDDDVPMYELDDLSISFKI